MLSLAYQQKLGIFRICKLIKYIISYIQVSYVQVKVASEKDSIFNPFIYTLIRV